MRMEEKGLRKEMKKRKSLMVDIFFRPVYVFFSIFFGTVRFFFFLLLLYFETWISKVDDCIVFFVGLFVINAIWPFQLLCRYPSLSLMVTLCNCMAKRGRNNHISIPYLGEKITYRGSLCGLMMIVVVEELH